LAIVEEGVRSLLSIAKHQIKLQTSNAIFVWRRLRANFPGASGARNKVGR
jgi:hypothetical protein